MCRAFGVHFFWPTLYIWLLWGLCPSTTLGNVSQPSVPTLAPNPSYATGFVHMNIRPATGVAFVIFDGRSVVRGISILILQ